MTLFGPFWARFWTPDLRVLNRYPQSEASVTMQNERLCAGTCSEHDRFWPILEIQKMVRIFHFCNFPKKSKIVIFEKDENHGFSMLWIDVTMVFVAQHPWRVMQGMHGNPPLGWITFTPLAVGTTTALLVHIHHGGGPHSG